MDILHLTVRENDPVLYLKITLPLDGSIKILIKGTLVSRVNPFSRGPVLPALRVRIKPVDAIMFPGPKEVFLRLN